MGCLLAQEQCTVVHYSAWQMLCPSWMAFSTLTTSATRPELIQYPCLPMYRSHVSISPALLGALALCPGAKGPRASWGILPIGAYGLAIGMRTTVRERKNATLNLNSFEIFFDGTSEMMYNDHVVGTPPLVVRLVSSESRREVSSFLPRYAAIILPNTPAVKLQGLPGIPEAPSPPINQCDRECCGADAFTGPGHPIWPRSALLRSNNVAYNTLKGARTVPRGLGASDGPWLPDPPHVVSRGNTVSDANLLCQIELDAIWRLKHGKRLYYSDVSSLWKGNEYPLCL